MNGGETMDDRQDGTIPRPEHPRPDFVRETYQSLNGAWQFAWDDADEGLA